MNKSLETEMEGFRVRRENACKIELFMKVMAIGQVEISTPTKIFLPIIGNFIARLVFSRIFTIAKLTKLTPALAKTKQGNKVVKSV